MKKLMKKLINCINTYGYAIRDREAGNVIDVYVTYKKAQRELFKLEAKDKKEGIYTDNFYELYDLKNEVIL